MKFVFKPWWPLTIINAVVMVIGSYYAATLHPAIWFNVALMAIPLSMSLVEPKADGS